MLQVAIILVNYNSEKETRECLQSLRKIHKKDLQISTIIVDNGSKDPLDLPEKEQLAKTFVLRSDTNLGFTSGNNLGIKYALEHGNPDYFLLLNNDTTVDPDFLEELISCAQKNPEAGMITPKIYFSEGREYHEESYSAQERGKIFWYAGGTVDWRNLDAFHRGVDELDRGQFDTQHQSDFATGCCVLIPRAVLEKIGVLDKKYFLYLEDVDWSMRAREAGYTILFCPKAVVWHKNAGSSGGSGSAIQQYYQTRNRLFFFVKYLQIPSLQTTTQTPFSMLRAQLLVFRYSMKLLFTGTSIERRAVIDWLIGRMGKQAVL